MWFEHLPLETFYDRSSGRFHYLSPAFCGAHVWELLLWLETQGFDVVLELRAVPEDPHVFFLRSKRSWESREACERQVSSFLKVVRTALRAGRDRSAAPPLH